MTLHFEHGLVPKKIMYTLLNMDLMTEGTLKK